MAKTTARTTSKISSRTNNGSGVNLGFENKLWAAADLLRGHMDTAEYKHVVLGLLFLKCISNAFQGRYEQLRLSRARAKMRLAGKRLVRRRGYPPIWKTLLENCGAAG